MSRKVRTVIVSRHKSTQEVLKKIIIEHHKNFGDEVEIEVKEHVSDINELLGYDEIWGNIPMSLYTELLWKKGITLYLVSLEIPRELRGKELGIEELKKYMKITEFVPCYSGVCGLHVHLYVWKP